MPTNRNRYRQDRAFVALPLLAVCTMLTPAVAQAIPGVPVVSDDGAYSVEPDSLHASWSADDPAGEIEEYEYRIVRDAPDSGIIVQGWTDVGLETEVFATQLALLNGSAYFVEVRARYDAFFLTAAGVTDGIVVDAIAPSVSAVVDDGSYSNNTTSINASWTGNDQGTGIAEYRYAIGSSASGTDLAGWASAGLATSITASGLSLSDGQTAFVTVEAIDFAGNSGSKSADGITIDVTPPVILNLDDGGPWTRNTTALSAAWDGSVDGAALQGYSYALGTAAGASDVREWAGIGQSTSASPSGLLLNDGQTYYFSVDATDTLGNLSSAFSDGITVDISAPVLSIDDGLDISTDPNSVSATWSGTDSVSGIVSYEYSLGIAEDPEAIVPWTPAGLGTSAVMEGLNLQEGTVYLVFVAATDHAGNRAQLFADGFRIDVSGPAITVVSDGGTYLSAIDQVSASWAANDPTSGVASYRYCLGTAAGSCDTVGWTDAGLETNVVIDNLALSSGSSYFLTLEASDTLGNVSTASSDGILVDVDAPIVSDLDYGGAWTSDSTQLNASWNVSENESGLSDVLYALGVGADVESIVPFTSIGTASSVTISDLNLVEGSSYIVSIRAFDNAGNRGSLNGAGINVDVDLPEFFFIDDDAVVSNDLATLSASWLAVDTTSGIAEYRFAIGTTPGDTNVLDWTSAGLSESVVITDLTLSDGGDYYISAMAFDQAGNEATAVADGVHIDASAPLLGQVSIAAISHDAVTLDFDTDETATVVIEYGLDASLGFFTNASAAAISHSIDIDFLAPETSYFYRVTASDDAGNDATSALLNFTTLSDPVGTTVTIEDVQWFDAARDRDVPARIYAPTPGEAGAPFPLLLLSHGFGESMSAYEFLGVHLANQGYIVVSVNHAGSDIFAIVDGVPVGIEEGGHWTLRPADLEFALDTALSETNWLLDGRIDADRIGAIGHSLGSTTALTTAGLRINIAGTDNWQDRDPRVRAVVAMSPQVGNALDPNWQDLNGLHPQSWDDIHVPALVMWGTLDFGANDDLRSEPWQRELIFDALPDRHSFSVVIEDADHAAFTVTDPWYPASERDPRHYGWIEGTIESFFDSYLLDDGGAKTSLADKAIEADTGFEVRLEHKLEWEYDFSAVDAFLEDPAFLAATGPGADVQLWKDDAIIYQKSVGVFTPDHVVPLASATKWISGGVVMALVDDGVFSLDDTAGQYLPEFIDTKGSMTLRQMYALSSGLPDAPTYHRDTELTMAEAVSLIAGPTVNLVADPGELLHYGGLGMQTTGYIGTVLTGMDWQAIFDQYIGGPLGMNNTDYFAFGPTENPNVAGSGLSTSNDYLKFLLMLINDGVYEGQRVLSEDAVEAIFSLQSGDIPISRSAMTPYDEYAPGIGDAMYGIGTWLIETDPVSGAGIEVFAGGGFGSVAFIDRSLNFAGVFIAEQHDEVFNSSGESVNPAAIEYFAVRELIDDAIAAGLRSPYADAYYKPDDGALTPVEIDDVRIFDSQRERQRRYRVHYPEEAGSYPLIVLSHFSGGSRLAYDPLVDHWVSNGYVVIQPDHADSPEDFPVQEPVTPPGPASPLDSRGGFASMLEIPEDEPGYSVWADRPIDVTLLLDSLDMLEARISALAGKIDRSRIGMAGHYLGAHTAGLLSGMKMYSQNNTPQSFLDSRVQAVMMLSPTGAGADGLTEESWDEMFLPMFVMTGTDDASGRTGNGPEWRTDPFHYAPPGDKFLCWVQGLGSDYGGLVGNSPLDDVGFYVKTATIAFWDAYLLDTPEAQVFLSPEGLGTASEGDVEVTVR